MSKTQLNCRVEKKLSDQFAQLTKRMGGDKYTYIEAALKALIASPDSVINYLKQADTSTEDATDFFAGFHNRRKLISILTKQITTAADEKDRALFYRLIILTEKTFRLP